MSTIEIATISELRPGDTATFDVTYNGHPATLTGQVWSDRDRDLRISTHIARWEDGRGVEGNVFVSATRPAPALPTEPGSVILATEVRGSVLDPPAMLVRFEDEDGWSSLVPINGCYMHHPELITAWTLAKVVSA